MLLTRTSCVVLTHPVTVRASSCDLELLIGTRGVRGALAIVRRSWRSGLIL